MHRSQQQTLGKRKCQGKTHAWRTWMSLWKLFPKGILSHGTASCLSDRKLQPAPIPLHPIILLLHVHLGAEKDISHSASAQFQERSWTGLWDWTRSESLKISILRGSSRCHSHCCCSALKMSLNTNWMQPSPLLSVWSGKTSRSQGFHPRVYSFSTKDRRLRFKFPALG